MDKESQGRLAHRNELTALEDSGDWDEQEIPDSEKSFVLLRNVDENVESVPESSSSSIKPIIKDKASADFPLATYAARDRDNFINGAEKYGFDRKDIVEVEERCKESLKGRRMEADHLNRLRFLKDLTEKWGQHIDRGLSSCSSENILQNPLEEQKRRRLRYDAILTRGLQELVMEWRKMVARDLGVDMSETVADPVIKVKIPDTDDTWGFPVRKTAWRGVRRRCTIKASRTSFDARA
ncbi:hypothetical protein H2200_007854 [Cladophialophora chaetospira]|uniref:Uncharacterized protein n=1 Tax=Cladophialophora chaetospira TaxID=386627 RepID=A0AA38X6N0_9EURO|nr:hypothetical protein H2200_007854 [Cladophialophora chaetospira]